MKRNVIRLKANIRRVIQFNREWIVVDCNGVRHYCNVAWWNERMSFYPR